MNRTGRVITTVVILAVLAVVVVALSQTKNRRHRGHHAQPPTTVTGAPGSSPSLPSVQPPTHRQVPAPQTSPPPGALNVVSYGADPSGSKDSTMAMRNAVADGEKKAGSTVYFPAGKYILNLNDGAKQDITIDSNPINLIGAGPNATTIVEQIGAKSGTGSTSKAIFQIVTGPNGQPGGGDGTVISGFTLDAATFDAGTTIMDFGNNTTLAHLRIFGARSNHNYNSGTFGVRVITICNHTDLATKHRSGNLVDDLTITGQGQAGNTDLDFSCQIGSAAENITDTGNGLDVYICNDVEVDNFNYTPGTLETSPKSFVVTGPANDLTFNNVTTSGNGGQLRPSPNGYVISNTTIDHLTMTDPSQELEIGDSSQTTVRDSTIGVLKINPMNAASGLTVTNSRVASVACVKRGAISALVGVRCS